MPTLSDVKELFAPLGKRLYHFESKKYITESWKYMDDYDIISFFEYQSMMETIAKNSNLYDPSLVCEEAKYYLLRTTNILNNLEPIEKEIIYFGPDSRTKIATEEIKTFWSSFYLNELSCYIDNLHTIINTCELYSGNSIMQNSEKKVEQIVIELPENFTVTQLNKHFDPILTANQAALFLYYLQQTRVMPPYSNQSLGIMAQAIFSKNKKNVTTSISALYYIKQSSEDLNAIKNILQSMIKAIDADIKDPS